jgi:DNA topoisomerase IB
MRDKHARVNGSAVRFEFRGKSGIQHAIDLRDRRLARIIKSCRELPGYELFKYVDNDGRHQVIDSADVNAYLREISGQDFTAKDFRTWAGTVLAAKALAGDRRLQVHGRSEAEHRPRDRRGGEAPRQHQSRVAQVLHPSRDPRRLHAGRHDRER